MNTRKHFSLFAILSFCLIWMSCSNKDEIKPKGAKACIEISTDNLFVDAKINFDGSCSEKGEDYIWEFDDGKTYSDISFSRAFSEAKTYSVTLTITDSLGNIATVSQDFEILPSPYIVHEGIIETSEIWKDGLHLVKNDVMINGGSVTIEAGATIYVNKGVSIYIGDTFSAGKESHFGAIGTELKPINFLPASGTESPGEWGHLYFTENTSANSSLIYCNIKYGGIASYYSFVDSDYNNHGIIDIEDCKITIENTSIEGGLSHGVNLIGTGAFNSFINNSISNINNHPIQIDINSAHTIGVNNSILSNKGIYLKGGNYLQEDQRWLEQDVPYEIVNYVEIGSSTSSTLSILTLAPGTQINFHSQSSLSVSSQGKLKAVGTMEKPILFSSAQDSKNSGDWNYIYAYGASSFDYCTFEYGGGGITDIPGLLIVGSDSTTINNSTFKESSTNGLVVNAGNLVNSSNNSFSNCAEYGLVVNGSLVHKIDATHNFNCTRNILIRNNAILYESATWIKRTFPYYFSGKLEIRDNVNGAGSLLLQPGVEIRFLPTASIIVDGGFIADGSSETITLTLDENYTSDMLNNWGTIHFISGTLSDAKIINCNISFGGNNPGYPYKGSIYCSGTTNTPLISNNEISSSASHGIGISSTASPVISNNIFTNNVGQDVFMQ